MKPKTQQKYICGQQVGGHATLMYGLLPIAYNGCGVIAVYNALSALGCSTTFFKILKDFEDGGFLSFGGRWGTKSKKIAPYIEEFGFKTITKKTQSS